MSRQTGELVGFWEAERCWYEVETRWTAITTGRGTTGPQPPRCAGSRGRLRSPHRVALGCRDPRVSAEGFSRVNQSTPTEDLCHQSGGVAGRARPEKRAPSMRPTHTHRTRRVAPTSTARPRAAPGPLAPPTPAAHAVPAMHAERSAATTARAMRPPRPRTHARSSRRVASSQRCHPPPRQPPQAPAA